MLRHLHTTSSVVALIAAASFFATSANAQGRAAAAANDDETNLEEVVVTGTSLKGVAPIGSTVISVGQEEIEKTGAINASQLVNTVPAITTSGSAPQGENAYSYYSPQIHSLAGSASNSTLVIVDGLRLVGGGTQYSQTDPNIIPTSAIQRVEVLADGASSVYGSDAVAGVVNFITRQSFDGLQVNVKGGWGDSYSNRDANAIWGKTWDTGGFYIAGQYSYQSILRNSDRPFLSRGDYRPFGGTNTNSFACAPATIRTPASGNNVYLSPGATSTVPNSAANAPCNNSIYDNALPEQWRANLMIKVDQEITDRLRFTGKMVYNRQATEENSLPGTLNNVTVFGPGSNRGGQINPYFRAPAGEPGATQETVSWIDLVTSPDEWGTVNSQSEFFYTTGVLDFAITEDWSAKLSNAFGSSRSLLANNDTFCGACANLALNGTTQTSGSTTASSIAGQNVVVLNLPLTAANALDVWSDPASLRSSRDLISSWYQNDSENSNYNQINQTKLEFQGPVFSLPAGEVRVAVGGEYMLSRLEQKIRGANNTGPSSTGSSQRNYKYKRNAYSAYVEVAIPLVSAEMEIPLVRRLDVNISGRYDHFSDVGDTKNPKFAVDWELMEGLKLRANYSTAFVAPPLAVIGDPSQGYLYASGSVGVAASLFVPVANYPEVRGVPGCANATTTCNIGLGTNQGLRRQLGGGFLNIVPQTGDAWSVGLDYIPPYIPGFAANITLFNNTFEGGVNSPNPNSIVNSAGLHDRLVICPNTCTTEQINTFANLAGGATINGAVPAQVYFLLDQSSGNVLNLDIQGIDFMFQYRIPTDSLGTFRIGDALTYFTRFDQNFGGGSSFSVLNTSGYNTTFPSIQFKNRASFGWDFGAFSADVFMNYTGSYRNWSNTSVAPVLVDSIGNPTGGGDKVKSQTIWDLHASYDFEDGYGIMENAQVYLDIQNVLDTDPSFYNGNTAGILGGAWGFNGFASNPIGRLVSVGVRAKF
ncbi:TonB-dependent receptor domain-containing protein [Phenylobacterium sp.]|uniref:TonB-dependent receptor domain-containing protein n=1 Tax=Phenylobacterium sp. TaxID=1871053 RepID=UPI002C811832|nr:TonB-dependent receptor [Phenylobacterium sp.]HVI31445.1 TonB-dependent receptor [Phenylobacterium sp.]